MTTQILIVNPDPNSAQALSNFFRERGEQLQQVTTSAAARQLIERNNLDLVLLDLHMPDDSWQEVLNYLHQRSSETKVVLTSDYPDPQRERMAKEHGGRVFLKQPFTPGNIEQALQTLSGADKTPSEDAAAPRTPPKVRVPVRLKITLPYFILALLLALAASYVVSRVIIDTIEERFTNQLIEAGKLTNDWMVQEEDRLLETLRLVAYTQGVPEALAAGDAERLREMILPLAVNYQEEAIELLDSNGTSVISLRHRPGGNAEDYDASRGETVFSQWPFVESVLAQRIEEGRDKYAGLTRVPWGNYLYVAGPILDDDDNLVGVILVGKSLPTLVRQIRQDTLAHTNLYDFDGRLLASSLLSSGTENLTLDPESVLNILERQDDDSLTRPISAASIDYSEILGPWEVRRFLAASGQAKFAKQLGVIGVSLAETFVVRPSQVTRLQIFLLTALAFLLVIALGVYVANRITGPLLRVVEASFQVAQGNLDVQVEAKGDDEVAVLSHSFNEMVTGLQEGSLYRDLLGRTVSPEVREQLRQGFASGDLRLEGQDTVATILVSDIHGFTTLAEAEDPSTIMSWLNEYFEALVPIIAANGGVISKFEGDAIMAFFGVLPRSLPPQESAYQACCTGLAMLEAIERLNRQRAERGTPPFVAGVGINTGPVTAGALGSADRMHYTVIGDTVNTTARLEGLARQFGKENSIVISQHTLFALGERRHEFRMESLGAHTVRGKAEQLLAYRLQPTTRRAA